ncbi:MAG: hypothetical protein IIC67_04375, partial [Thaumarchaeota archaeon]|nr:hypothetical protein [Nitrososphaerota archaeon]
MRNFPLSKEEWYDKRDNRTNLSVKSSDYQNTTIGIKVDPFAKCRIGTDAKQNYEEMFDTFGPKGNYVLPAHLTKLFFPSPEAFRNVYNLTDDQIKVLGKIDYFIKCRTASGKVNPTSYNIKTCIRPGPDLTPPRISVTNPLSGTFVKFGTDEREVIVYVNEPSECRWSVEDQDFNDMENQLTCETNPANYSLFGLPCSVTLTGISNNSKFYFRCRDLSENANTMSESFVFEFRNSESPLFIDGVIPREGEIITSSVEPASAKLRLRTSGGVDRGEAICQWEGNGFSDFFIYEEINGSNIHEYQLTSLAKGRYNINFMCEDLAGNEASNSTSFDIKVDKFGPKITRVYYDGGLKVVTSEKAECRYSFNRNYIFENATKLMRVEITNGRTLETLAISVVSGGPRGA